MQRAPRAAVSPHCRADWSGHETAVIDLPTRRAMGRYQRLLGIGRVVRHALLALLMLELLVVADASSSTVASGGTSPPGVATVSDAGSARDGKPAMQDTIVLSEGAGAKSQTTTTTGGLVSAEQRDKGNLEMLRALMLEADATESEKLTDSQYFLGVMSQKIKRHFLADLLSVILLFAGYYVLAAGLDRRPTRKTSNRSSKTQMSSGSQ
ncbi:uncharacterized protein EMH_0007580 [Eimeria mitis]|uniref:Transmembrane protein n=1 Tax=Eimeria mitis TaxID=44415 RepID=U6JNU0_9EIME|nr:uncharacterized protein EMH_0007580 [Eimeria mitis]CDJ27164.1 hypothetical protein, conserved [Eimeria mitis]